MRISAPSVPVAPSQGDLGAPYSPPQPPRSSAAGWGDAELARARLASYHRALRAQATGLVFAPVLVLDLGQFSACFQVVWSQ
jgi:hypothetical protein